MKGGRVFSILALLFCFLGISESISRTDSYILDNAETWISAWIHDANDFSGAILIPIVPNLFPDWVYRKVETRCSQGRCIILQGKHAGKKLDITFFSQQDVNHAVRIMRGEGMRVPYLFVRLWQPEEKK